MDALQLDSPQRRSLRRFAVLLMLLSLSALFLGACGGSPGPNSRAAAPTAASSGAGNPSPTNLTIALDHTTAVSASDMGRKYLTAVTRSAEPLLEHGGHLRVVTFAGAGVDPAVLFDEDIPALKGNKLARFLIDARPALSGLVAQAVGLKPAAADLAAALGQMGASGSDVAGSIDHETEQLRGHGGGVLLTLSDGFQRTGTVDLAAQIARMSDAQIVGVLAPLLPRSAATVAIRMLGVGISGRQVGLTTERAKKLVRGWTAACRRTSAVECAVKSEL